MKDDPAVMLLYGKNGYIAGIQHGVSKKRREGSHWTPYKLNKAVLMLNNSLLHIIMNNGIAEAVLFQHKRLANPL